MGVRLPSAYQEVEYLSGSGSQYIDSGIECTSDLSVSFGFVVWNSDNLAICGGINAQSYADYFRHHASPVANAGLYWLQYNRGGTASVNRGKKKKKKHDLSVDAINGIAVYDGEEIHFTPVLNKTTGRSYGIFARISDSGTLQSKAARIYYFKFYRNNNLIGDFVPCYRKNDTKPGMFDLVTGEFFVNQGTGEFNLGPDVTTLSVSESLMVRRRLLMQEQTVLPLEFDGSFYFKTGYIPTADTQVIVRFSCGNNTSVNNPIFGSRVSVAGESFYAWARIDQAKRLRIERCALHPGSMLNWTNVDYELTAGNEYTINTQDRTLVENDSVAKSWTYTGTAFEGLQYEMYIGGINNAGSLLGNLKYKGTFYQLQIIENGTVVRNYVPFNGKLKDRITGQVLEKY